MAVLTGRDLGELAVLLAERAAQLQEEIRAKLGEAADTVLASDHQWSDAGTASGEASLDYAEAARDIEELRAVRRAQARIDDGSYGNCMQCGSLIPLARLRAQPASLRCVDCQEALERTPPVAA
jgi:RNA polymerase-binding transcription factor DksA